MARERMSLLEPRLQGGRVMKERLSLARFGDAEKKILKSVWGEEILGPLFTEGYFEPNIDVFETAGDIVVKVEIAGMKKKEIIVELEGDTLIIRGRRDDKSPGRKVCYHQMEISYGTFERRIRIMCPIKRDRVTAFYRDGFLEVKLPRGDSRRRGE